MHMPLLLSLGNWIDRGEIKLVIIEKIQENKVFLRLQLIYAFNIEKLHYPIEILSYNWRAKTLKTRND